MPEIAGMIFRTGSAPQITNSYIFNLFIIPSFYPESQPQPVSDFHNFLYALLFTPFLVTRFAMHKTGIRHSLFSVMLQSVLGMLLQMCYAVDNSNNRPAKMPVLR